MPTAASSTGTGASTLRSSAAVGKATAEQQQAAGDGREEVGDEAAHRDLEHAAEEDAVDG